MHTYAFPRPAVTVDVAAFRWRDGWGLEVLLIQRGKEPHLGRWALPGGHVEPNEDLAPAASREFQEETGIKVSAYQLFQVGAYGGPGRDPRGHYITIAYTTKLHGDARSAAVAGDDAAKAEWFGIKELPELAFDHLKIILDALDEY